MKKRVLGKDLEVSAVGLSCRGAGHSGPPFPDKAENIAFFHRAEEMGQTFFDISELEYAEEELIGETLEPVRGRVKLAAGSGRNTHDGRADGPDSRCAAICTEVEGSLKRLRTDHFDLYYYRASPEVPIEEAAETMEKLAKEGKILHWGLLEAGADTIRRAHAVFQVTAVRCEYSLCRRKPKKEILPLLEELGIGLAASSPLGKESFAEDRRLAAAVGSFAEEKMLSSAQISLAWLLHQKPWIVPIPGAGTVCRLQENMSAAYVELSGEDIRRLTAAADNTPVLGGRYAVRK